MIHNLKQDFLTVNPFSRPGRELVEVKARVVHWVENPKQRAKAVKDYFQYLAAGRMNAAGQYIYASTQFAIGMDGEIIQMMPMTEVAYQGGSMTPWAKKFFGGNCNLYCIGAEHSHFDWTGRLSDPQYESSVLLNAILGAMFPDSELLLHYDLTSKACHRWFVNNPDQWQKYKAAVAAKRRELYGF